jgi:hypothetical protein
MPTKDSMYWTMAMLITSVILADVYRRDRDAGRYAEDQRLYDREYEIIRKHYYRETA